MPVNVSRRAQVDGELWVLLSVSEEANNDDEDEEKGEGEAKLPRKKQAPFLFWAPQSVYLERRALGLTRRPQQPGAAAKAVEGGGEATGEGPESGPSTPRLDPRADKQAAQSLGEVTLSDGATLPEVMVETLRKAFAEEWKAHAAQIQHSLQDMTERLEEKCKESEAAKEELAQYKVRAHSVLEAQAADIASANRELAEGAQLRAEHARLSAKITQLESQAKQYDPDEVHTHTHSSAHGNPSSNTRTYPQLLELRGQLEVVQSHNERLEEELKVTATS